MADEIVVAAPEVVIPEVVVPEVAVPMVGGDGETELPLVTEPGEVATETPEVKLNKRFSEVTRQRDEAAQRAAEADRRLSIALEALERAAPKPAKVVEAVVEDIEPEPPEFEDPEQYRHAMAAYTKEVTARAVKQELKAAEVEAQSRAATQAQQQQQLQQQQAWALRRQKAIEAISDYVAVAENPNIAISQAMAMAISGSELGPQLAYHLGQNPAVAEKIASMAPQAQLMELGKLEYQLSQPPKPQVTKVPAPINVLSGTATTQTKTVDDMSMEEYAAQRKKH